MTASLNGLVICWNTGLQLWGWVPINRKLRPLLFQDHHIMTVVNNPSRRHAKYIHWTKSLMNGVIRLYYYHHTIASTIPQN
jgi:hypothetical protein